MLCNCDVVNYGQWFSGLSLVWFFIWCASLDFCNGYSADATGHCETQTIARKIRKPIVDVIYCINKCVGRWLCVRFESNPLTLCVVCFFSSLRSPPFDFWYWMRFCCSNANVCRYTRWLVAHDIKLQLIVYPGWMKSQVNVLINWPCECGCELERVSRTHKHTRLRYLIRSVWRRTHVNAIKLEKETKREYPTTHVPSNVQWFQLDFICRHITANCCFVRCENWSFEWANLG